MRVGKPLAAEMLARLWLGAQQTIDVADDRRTLLERRSGNRHGDVQTRSWTRSMRAESGAVEQQVRTTARSAASARFSKAHARTGVSAARRSGPAPTVTTAPWRNTRQGPSRRARCRCRCGRSTVGEAGPRSLPNWRRRSRRRMIDEPPAAGVGEQDPADVVMRAPIAPRKIFEDARERDLQITAILDLSERDTIALRGKATS